MSFISSLIPGVDDDREKELRKRIRGEDSQANLAFQRARGAAGQVASTTAARAADQGLNVAAANRIASQGQQQAVAQASQQQAAGRASEVQRAEDELASMRAARSQFMQRLAGGALQTAAGMTSMLGVGGDQTGGGVQPLQAAATAAGGPLGGMAASAASPFLQRLIGREPATAQVDRALGYQPAVSNDQLLAAAPSPQAQAPASPAADPLAGFLRRQAAPLPDTVAGTGTQVGQQMSAGMVPPAGSNMTPQEWAEWLRQRGLGRG